MSTPEFTLSSPVFASAAADQPLLALTIAWHPELQRIGEQFLAVAGAPLEVSRYLPLFRLPGGDATGLGFAGISRAPLRIAQDADGVLIVAPDSRMVVEVNGVRISGPHRLSVQQIEDGVVLGLGRVVHLCLHWMRCLPQPGTVPGLLGVGSAAVRLRSLVRQAAASDTAVLLLGQTGTGKEVAARAIHALSHRTASPMVSVNMATLNESLAAADLFGASRGAYTGAQTVREGLFAEAEDSTLFLDEIGNTPAAVQPMLLRVLETGDYRPLGAQRDRRASARLIAATDQDLYGEGFNQALLRRLEGFIIHLPPLKARREDIGVLMAQLLQDFADADGQRVELPADLAAQFLLHDWPGNIRQLRHVLKRVVQALQAGDSVQFGDFIDLAVAAQSAPVALDNPAPAVAAIAAARTRTRLEEVSEQAVLQAMCDSGWQVLGAAQALGVSRPSMYKLLASHPQIRTAERIAPDELRQAWLTSGGDLQACAAQLHTPTEALRRRMRALEPG